MSKKSERYPFVSSAKQNFKMVGARLADKHLNLAVTGLSGSGKTAFITSLVNQLLEAKDGADLPFFSLVREQRLQGVRREVQPNLSLSRFSYEEAMDDLNALPATWPQSTRGISQVRLRLRYRKNSGLSRYFSDQGTLTLDITDYPGEWLLDLPLLDMDFHQWSTHSEGELAQPKRQELAESFLLQRDGLDLNAPGDELALQAIAQTYTDYLHACRAHGFQLLQPGRFILPGELEGAPVLHFFPLSESALLTQKINLNAPKKGSNAQLLINRFEHYQEKVVKPFYQRHFKRFDRQVVLVDCLTALNHGKSCFSDLQQALNWLLGSFEYGKSSVLKRLFNPKIDKLIFAASKADHVTPDQQNNLVKLLDSMLHSARQQIQFDGVLTESTAIAAIRSSRAGVSQYEGQSLQVLKGQDVDGQSVTLFPGDVPQQCPDDGFWQHQDFEFPSFAPPSRASTEPLPHIRMDRILDFILGDKMQ